MNIQNSLFFLTLLFSSSLLASSYEIGDSLVPVLLNDQHEKSGSINETTRIVLFSRDKKGGELLTDALSSLPKDVMAEQKIVYISDISGMPGLIAKYMAIPAMQKKPFSILLDEDGNSTKNYPNQKGMAILIFINSLRITKITYLDSIDTIIKTLTPP